MYSTELIRKFPEQPTDPILYVVYEDSMIDNVEFLIASIYGQQYLDDNVTVVAFNDPFQREDKYYSVYIDPLVYKYKHSWNN